MTDDYILKYTNGYANYTGKIDEDELTIKGDCKITNYDPRVDDGKGKGEITIDLTGGEQTVKAGTGNGYRQTKNADFSKKKFSIFKDIAALDGNANELSVEDIRKMDKSLIEKWGLNNLRFDYKNGVATLVWGENDILRIDFVTKKEKKIKKSNSTTSSSQVSGTKESGVISETTDTIKDTKAFLEALGAQETKGKDNPYFCMNKAGYVGKYQMGEQAMADMGIYYKKNGKYNNDWSGIFRENKYGINCLWDYRKSPEKQEQLQVDYKKKDWQYIKNKGLLCYVGKTINGVVITESGMLAGAHLVGAGGLSRYLKSNGTDDVKDGTGTPVSKYIEQFAGYDVSEIIT